MNAAGLQVSLAIARRAIIHTYKNPAIIVPSLAFPLVFLLAFAGGLSAVSNVPGFSFRSGYTAFQFVFVFLQMAAFGGLFTGYRLAEDYESGFARRLLLAAPSRIGIITGYVIAGLFRFLVIGAILWALALATGMNVDGSLLEVLGLVGLGALMAVICSLWTIGLAFRFQTVDIGSFMQTPVFILLFLAPVYVPIALLSGWLHGAASINPVTLIIDAGRGFISGEPTQVLYAYAASLAIAGLAWLWAVRQLRRAERGAA